MKKREPQPVEKVGRCDFPLIILVTILTMFGIVMVFSASYYTSINTSGTPYSYLKKQGVFAGIGFFIMLFFSRVDYRHIAKFARLFALVEIVLLLLIFTPLGKEVYNARRWLDFKIITVMPGELAKPVIILLAAKYFSENMKRAKRLLSLLPLVLYTLFVCLLILKQPNLSTAITVFLIAFGVAFLAGMGWRYVLLLVGLIVGGSSYLFFIDTGYQHTRFVTFLDPFKNAMDEGFQVVQSLLALGSGGITGLGLGKSIQKNLYLPEPQNDFILAIIGEELGFLGILVLMILYALLIGRIFYIAVKARDNLGLLIAGGTGIMIGTQVILNVGVVTSSLPPTGVALPFVSYGGNALWVFMMLAGILLNISRKRVGREGRGEEAAEP